MTQNPYSSLPNSAFWRTGAALADPLEIRGLWQPKADITKSTRIVTAGSCFAQHIGRAFRERGFAWLDAEAAPGTADVQRAFHYGTFSFRTGNIYTPQMLLQWVRWATATAPMPDLFWQQEGRFFDPFRPAVEPGGFASLHEARASRQATLNAIRTAIRRGQLFVFTLGLTECWRDAETGLEYAVCPGTIAGRFDADRHRFHNMAYPEVMATLKKAITTIRRFNRDMRFLLTVSPVPLTATAGGQHVIMATTQSKSVLRAAAGEMTAQTDFVDYFPSYEIITSPVFGGRFYAPNRRSVEPAGVDHVMRCFFHDLDTAFGRTPSDPAPAPVATDPEDDAPDPVAELRCEEEMLAAFQVPQ
jgi:hypothetical protein